MGLKLYVPPHAIVSIRGPRRQTFAIFRGSSIPEEIGGVAKLYDPLPPRACIGTVTRLNPSSKDRHRGGHFIDIELPRDWEITRSNAIRKHPRHRKEVSRG